MDVTRLDNRASRLSPDASSLVLENGRDGVLVADMRMRDHPIVHVKASFEAINGSSAAEAIGRNCHHLGQ